MKKQIILIASLALAFVLLLVGYLAILSPILNRPTLSETADYVAVSDEAQQGLLYYVAGTYEADASGTFVLDKTAYSFRAYTAGDGDASAERYRKTSEEGYTRVSPIPAGTDLGEGHYVYGIFSALSGTSNGTLTAYGASSGTFALKGKLPAGESLDGLYAFTPGTATVDDVEWISSAGLYMMFPQLSREQIAAISVSNSHGTYRIVRDESDTLVIDGFEEVPYDGVKMSALISCVGYPSTADRICIYADDAQMAEYGLDEPVASFTVTDIYGASYTVEVGDALLAASGYYYVRLVGRDAVYSMSMTRQIIAADYSSVTSADLLFEPVEYLASPALVAGLTVNNYYTVNNLIMLDETGERLFAITNTINDRSDTSDLDQTVAGVADSLTELSFYPASPYLVDTETVWNTVYGLASGDLGALECVRLVSDVSEYGEFGLASPHRTFYFEVRAEDGTDGAGQVKYKTAYRIFLYFSTRRADGTYYCMSSLYPEVITSVSADSFSFIEEPFYSWVSNMIFPEDIKNITSLRVEGNDRTLGRQDVTFTLHHDVTKTSYLDSNGELQYNYTYLLDVDTDAGISFPNAEVQNFRLFYYTLLSVAVRGKAGLSDEETAAVLADPGNVLLRFTYVKSNGQTVTVELRTYTSAGRRVLICPVGGEAVLYAMADDVSEVLTSLDQLMRGVVVNPDTPG